MKPLLIGCLVFVSSLNVFATVRTWDGGGGDANWQTAANWAGDLPPVAGDDLVFPAAAAQFSANNNFPLLTSFNSITIEGGAYTLAGNFMRLANGITVNGGAQTINIAITLTGAQTFSTTAAGATLTLVSVSTGTSGLTFDGPGVTGIGLISGSGGIIKNGSGAGALISSFGYSGSITISNGIFVVDASIPGSAVTVNSSATGGTFGLSGLGGTGTVGTVNVAQGGVSAGTLTSPTGVLNISGGLAFTANGAYVCKIGGITPGSTGHDQLNVTGTVNLAGARLGPLPWNGFRPANGESFTIVRNDGTDAVVGTFANAPEGSIFAGPLNTAFRITYQGGDGNDIVVTRVPRAQFDFDGDGRTDISSYRRTGGFWRVQPSSGGANTSVQWGAPADVITPADFDGDNRTDVAIFRPSTGDWWILNSFTSTVSTIHFGQGGDIPRPADFDGDGRADLVVFRPSDGVWYQLRSLGNQFLAQQFGLSGDQPQILDFDGDGMADLSVYRPADGVWHVWQSATSTYAAFGFGISTDVPVPGDYNGDGRTDAAVFRATADPGQPDFYILFSGQSSYTAVDWGLPEDVPVVGDYDGDGRADIAVYRPSTTVWYLLRSTAGFSAVAFGLTLDRAIPSAYNP
ncbi:MAG TPA: VCBS repeat-containing protein [Pyrinomonadaceae bacterium]|nr:VCBS repeat-containing protein [Pyrinomonadaceae bacterium]